MRYRLLKLAFKISKTTPKLARQLFKIAAPLTFDSASPNSPPFQIVYRIQNSQGLGFWHKPENWLSLQDHNKFQYLESLKGGTAQSYSRLPDPLSDMGFLPAERQTFPGKLFAFESLAQANKFIMPQQWTLLSANGFTLVPVRAKKIWSSGSQVYYEPF